MKLSNGEDIRSIVANSFTVSFNSLASSKLGLTSMLILYPNKLAINFAYSCCVFHWEIKYVSTMMSSKKCKGNIYNRFLLVFLFWKFAISVMF